jgi:hypothetical protein
MIVKHMKAKCGLVAIFVFMVTFKLVTLYRNPSFNQANDTALFWTESALQYRTAKLIAAHGTVALQDEKLQHPEGVNIKERLTILMETITGCAYRYCVPKSIPFHVFVLIFVALVSSLSVFPLHGAISLISRSKGAGLTGAAFYAATPAVYTTVIAPGFEYQDFALPLIFIHIYFFIRAMKAPKASVYAHALLSGAFLFAGFCAWHLTQFYYTLFVVFILICFMLLRDFNMKPFYVIVVCAVVAGYLIPAQKSAGFLVSFSMLLSYAVITGSVIPREYAIIRKVLTGFLIMGAVLVTSYIAFVSVPEYRLVYGLMVAKITHLGMRPHDPSSLPWETLVMWVSPFIGPDIKTITLSIGSLVAGGVIGIMLEAKHLFKRNFDAGRGLMFFFSIMFIPLYLLLIRMDAFLVWFLSFQAGMMSTCRKTFLKIMLGLFILVNVILLLRMPERTVGPDRNYLFDMIKYVRQKIPQDAPVLTSFAYGPTIAAYSDRPILLHPKFEAQHITEKIKSFEHRLYADENTFYAFCTSYKARYFVYQADMLLALNPESMRYRTHNCTVSRDCAASKFHLYPDQLVHFELVFSNPHYRIYRVLNRNENAQHCAHDYFRIYDATMLRLSNLGIY